MSDPIATSTEDTPHPQFHAQSPQPNLRETPSGLIRCENVDVFYGDFRAVTDVNLSFKRTKSPR